jgi:hypothetical protein
MWGEVEFNDGAPFLRTQWRQLIKKVFHTNIDATPLSSNGSRKSKVHSAQPSNVPISIKKVFILIAIF